METKKARLIYNPSAGREEVKKNICRILEYLEELGYETSTFMTKGKKDALNEAKRVSEEGFDLIVSAGGDGTLNEIINGMCRAEKQPKLAILPFGTSNDFATSLGIPKKLDEALEIIKNGKVTKTDIGKMGNKYFINIAGGGALTDLTYEVPVKLKTVLGQLAYYIKGIEKIVSFKPYHMRIETDDRVIDEEIMLFLVTNSNIVGGYKKIAPHARVNDGLFDVLLLKKCHIADLARLMPLVLNGTHIHDPKVEYFQTRRIKIEAPETVLINLDGELGGTAPCEFEILKEHIQVITNK